MRGSRIILAVVLAVLWQGTVDMASAQVPPYVNYQGRIIRSGTNFNGIALFKFKLLSENGSTACWSNDGSGGGGDEPALAVPIPVNRGLFYAGLGDTNLTHMVALPPSVFTNANLRLRIWVDSGSGFELITPDQGMASVGYAMLSANIEDGVVTPAKLSPEARGFFVQTTGGAMTGPLTNAFGFHGIGGILSNAVLMAASNGFSVGVSQLTVFSNRVGIGTATPAAALEVMGGDADGEVVFKVCSGTNVVAWGRKKRLN